MLENKLTVTVRQFRLYLCAVGMRSSKTRDQPQMTFNGENLYLLLFSPILGEFVLKLDRRAFKNDSLQIMINLGIDGS